jgi:hypothetical protein
MNMSNSPAQSLDGFSGSGAGKRQLVGLALLLAAVAAGPDEAFAWGPATHAYIADHIGMTEDVQNLNEMYGAMVPDLFNTYLAAAENPDLMACLRNGSHGDTLTNADAFKRIWELVRFGFARSAAFGYMSHNDLWGSDNGARWTSSNGTFPGYTILKAQQLMLAIQNDVDASGRSAWDYLGIEPSPGLLPDPLGDPALLMCHFMIEQAGDVVIRRHDPDIGLKLALAAVLRAETLKPYLVKMFVGCPTMDARKVGQAEEAFRQQTLMAGLTFLHDEAEILADITQVLADQAPVFIAAATGEPFDPQLLPLLPRLLSQSLQTALGMIQDDFMTEIGSITGSLEFTMHAHGVQY